jgi:hypothetical protein
VKNCSFRENPQTNKAALVKDKVNRASLFSNLVCQKRSYLGAKQAPCFFVLKKQPIAVASFVLVDNVD